MTIEQIPLAVKPRKTGYAHLPIIVVRKGQAMSENGIVADIDKVDWRKLPSTLVVGVNLARLVAELDERYRADSDWQWKARDSEMAIGKLAVQQRTVVDFFGFRADRSKGHDANTYHYCLDAFSFYTNSDTLPTEQTGSLKGLLQWGLTIRDYCQSENLAVKATSSGVSVQSLRNPRFYPHVRRKIPHATNSAVRQALPGNYYRL